MLALGLGPSRNIRNLAGGGLPGDCVPRDLRTVTVDRLAPLATRGAMAKGEPDAAEGRLSATASEGPECLTGPVG
jgi:hypothetical protein